MRKPLTLAATLAVVATLGAGCSTKSPSTSAAPTTAAPATSSVAPSESPSVAPSESPSASPGPSMSTGPAAPAGPLADGKLKRGEKGAEITELQNKLTELGYWNGTADGNFGDSTQQAVYALQKAAGLGRDGVVGPDTKKALDAGTRPAAKSTSGYVIEIDKKKQVLMLVQDGKVLNILNTSTGSGEKYQRDGNTYTATTPAGHFKVSRQIDGWRDAPLGLLWRPKYFNGGIAVHGANSVPPSPASHGCARVSIAGMNWLWTGGKIPIGTAVWVY
jgi:peptidoglycan hydrolase-like protein with peptidoglycan-binding domain